MNHRSLGRSGLSTAPLASATSIEQLNALMSAARLTRRSR